MEPWRLLIGWAFAWGPEVSADPTVRLGDTWSGDTRLAPIAAGGSPCPGGSFGDPGIIIWDDAPCGKEFSRACRPAQEAAQGPGRSGDGL